MSLVSNAEKEETKMQAYFGQQEVKDKFVQRMKDHIAADELIRGTGFEDGRGCAVGCTLNRYDHAAFETELGVPEWAARLIDTLHENTSADVWPTFSLRFLEAVRPGANLEPIRNKINIFIQERSRERVEGLDIADNLKNQIIKAIDMCIKCHVDEMTGVAVPGWSAAESAARSAAAAAWSAESAESAAWSAAWSARSAESAESARSAWWSAEMDAIAEEFIRLCGEC